MLGLRVKETCLAVVCADAGVQDTLLAVQAALVGFVEAACLVALGIAELQGGIAEEG